MPAFCRSPPFSPPKPPGRSRGMEAVEGQQLFRGGGWAEEVDMLLRRVRGWCLLAFCLQKGEEQQTRSSVAAVQQYYNSCSTKVQQYSKGTVVQ